MKHLFTFCLYFAFLIVAQLTVGQSNQNKSKKDEANSDFISFLIVSRLETNLDFLHKAIVKNMSLKSVNKIYKNEYFSIFPLFLDVFDNEDVVFDIVVRSPDNNVVFHKKGIQAKERTNILNSFVIPKSAFEIYLDDSAPTGIYTALVIAKNSKTKKVSYFQDNFVVAEWTSTNFTPIEKSKDFWNILCNYHNNQSPIILCNLLGSPHGQIISKGKINHTFFIFFREALRKKPFLIELFDKNFDLLDNNTRKNVVMAFASLGESYRFRNKKLTSEEKSLQTQILTSQFNIISPYEKTFAGLHTIDLLWGEFYAKGNYTPIERTLQYLNDINSAEALSKGNIVALSPLEIHSGILFISSAYSIMKNASVKLAMSYVDFYVKENPEKFKENKLKRTFDIVNEYLKTSSP